MDIDIIKSLKLICEYVCFLFVFGLSFCFCFCCYLTIFEHEQFEYEKIFLLFIAFIFSFVVFYFNEKEKNNKDVYNVQKEIILRVDVENNAGTYSEKYVLKEVKKEID